MRQDAQGGLGPSATRRGFLAGIAAGVAVPSLGRAAEADGSVVIAARQEIVRRGRAIAVSPDGRRVVVAHDARRTVAVIERGRTRLVDVGGQPLAVAVSPDGRTAAVTTAFWDKPGLAVVDLVAARRRDRVDVGPVPWGVAFTPDGRRIVVTGGEQEGTVHVLDVKTLTLAARGQVGLVPRGVAVEPDGRHAWVALQADARVVRVDLRAGRVRRTIRTASLPEQISISPEGRRLLVSHGGPGAEHVSEIVVRSGRIVRHRAGRRPVGVGWTGRGRRLVAVAGDNRIVFLTAGRGKPRSRSAGGAPRGLAVAGERAFTVDAVTGAVTRVRI